VEEIEEDRLYSGLLQVFSCEDKKYLLGVEMKNRSRIHLAGNGAACLQTLINFDNWEYIAESFTIYKKVDKQHCRASRMVSHLRGEYDIL
ncbi:hypothetical protein LCGC14_2276250, partial [marine sediment metagenome]